MPLPCVENLHQDPREQEREAPAGPLQGCLLDLANSFLSHPNSPLLQHAAIPGA